MNRAERKRLRSGVGFTSLWIIGLGTFTAYPVLASLYYSFCDYSILKSPVWIGLENYQNLMADEVFWLSMRNTLVYTALSVPLGAILALGLAVLLNQDVRGKSFFRVCFYLPSVVPVVASVMIWMWIFNGEFGLLNSILRPILSLIGLEPPTWLGDPVWAKPAIVLMSLWGVGNAMVIYLAGLQDIPRFLYESAEIDGASPWQRFWHITLPMLAPVIYFNVVMGLINALQVFAQPYILAAASGLDGLTGSPARSTLFFTIELFSTAFADLRMGYASSMAYVLFVIIAGLTWLATRLSRRHMEDAK